MKRLALLCLATAASCGLASTTESATERSAAPIIINGRCYVPLADGGMRELACPID